MPEKLEPPAGKSKTWIFGILGVLVIVGGACVCGAFAIGLPAFQKYVNKSKAIEAETSLGAIAVGAKAHFDDRCEFPPTAGPLPPLLDCCEETCRRTEQQMTEEGWTAVGFNTNEPHRFEYRTIVEDDRYVIRARGDLDCDGEHSLYEQVLTGDRDACEATVENLTTERPFE